MARKKCNENYGKDSRSTTKPYSPKGKKKQPSEQVRREKQEEERQKEKQRREKERRERDQREQYGHNIQIPTIRATGPAFESSFDAQKTGAVKNTNGKRLRESPPTSEQNVVEPKIVQKKSAESHNVQESRSHRKKKTKFAIDQASRDEENSPISCSTPKTTKSNIFTADVVKEKPNKTLIKPDALQLRKEISARKTSNLATSSTIEKEHPVKSVLKPTISSNNSEAIGKATSQVISTVVEGPPLLEFAPVWKGGRISSQPPRASTLEKLMKVIQAYPSIYDPPPDLVVCTDNLGLEKTSKAHIWIPAEVAPPIQAWADALVGKSIGGILVRAVLVDSTGYRVFFTVLNKRYPWDDKCEGYAIAASVEYAYPSLQRLPFHGYNLMNSIIRTGWISKATKKNAPNMEHRTQEQIRDHFRKKPKPLYTPGRGWVSLDTPSD